MPLGGYRGMHFGAMHFVRACSLVLITVHYCETKNWRRWRWIISGKCRLYLSLQYAKYILCS